MKRADLESYRRTLEAKQTELPVSHRNVDGRAVERVADSMDEAILANERDLALHALTREACMCRQVSAALRSSSAIDGDTASKGTAGLDVRGISWPAPIIRRPRRQI